MKPVTSTGFARVNRVCSSGELLDRDRSKTSLFYFEAYVHESIIFIVSPPQPALLTLLHYYCTLLRSIRHPSNPPRVCHTPCNVGHNNIVQRPKLNPPFSSASPHVSQKSASEHAAKLRENAENTRKFSIYVYMKLYNSV